MRDKAFWRKVCSGELEAYENVQRPDGSCERRRLYCLGHCVYAPYDSEAAPPDREQPKAGLISRLFSRAIA